VYLRNNPGNSGSSGSYFRLIAGLIIRGYDGNQKRGGSL